VNIQEYISGGIVESYVLGLADEAERAEFEQMCAQHAEVRAARDAFELSLEQHAMAAAVPPPAHVRDTVLQQLAAGPDTAEGKTAAPVVQMRPVKRSAMPVAIRYVAAASIVLLAGSIGLNVYYFNYIAILASAITSWRHSKPNWLKITALCKPGSIITSKPCRL
jgi:anti-sigma-K factor RskA